MAEIARRASPDVTVFGYPLWGHTNPSLRVVRRFVERGLRVDYWSLPPFREAVEAAGARFRVYPELAAPLMAPGSFGSRLKVLARCAPLLVDCIGGDATPLVMHDSLALWGPVIAARWGATAVASVTTFAVNHSLLTLLGVDSVLTSEEWAEIGQHLKRLDPNGFVRPQHMLLPRGALKVVYTSRAVQPGGSAFDSTHLFIGPMLQAPEEQQRDLVYVSLGTVFNESRKFFTICLAYLRATHEEAVLSLGGGLSPDAFTDVPSTCHIVAHAAQRDILARARLFVTHGGMNSVSEALVASVPMILVPQDADQMLVSRRMEQLGCGIVLPPAQVSPDTLAACAAQIARDQEGFVARCQVQARSFPDRTQQDEMLGRVLEVAGPAGHG